MISSFDKAKYYKYINNNYLALFILLCCLFSYLLLLVVLDGIINETNVQLVEILLIYKADISFGGGGGGGRRGRANES